VAKMANGDTLERLLSPEQRRKDEREEQRARMAQWLILAILIAVTAIWVAGIVWAYNQPRIRNMTISNARIMGASAICPGDTLTVSYYFHAEGSGLLDVDNSLWSVDPPPRTIVYSASRRFVLAETIDQEMVEAWAVPTHYVDFATGKEVPLAPGTYRRDLAISAPIRGSVLATASVEFEVRENCP
jgi:hypothetical protein